MRSTLYLTFVGIILLCGASGRADFVPVSQSRSVGASANMMGTFGGMPQNDSSSDSKSAADFGPFDEVVGATVTLANCSANQNSQIGPLAVSASGGVSAFGAGQAGNEGIRSGVGQGGSMFSFTFDLDAPTPISLHAMLLGPVGAASVQLTGPTGSLVDFSTNSGNQNKPLTYDQELEPGRYTIAASARAVAVVIPPIPGPSAGASAGSSYQFTLQVVPEPASLLPALAVCSLISRRTRRRAGKSRS